jgi:hypothetical protein
MPTVAHCSRKNVSYSSGIGRADHIATVADSCSTQQELTKVDVKRTSFSYVKATLSLWSIEGVHSIIQTGV